MMGSARSHFISILCLAALLWPSLPMAQEQAEQQRPCSSWSEAQQGECEERPAVRDVSGVVAKDVTRPVERSGGTRAKKFFRSIGKGLLFVPKLAVTVLLIPIRGTVSLVSQYDLIERTTDLLYNDARTAALIPLIGIESGFGVTGGAMAFHHDLWGSGERLSVSAKFGGRYVQGYQVRFRADNIRDVGVWTDLRMRYEVNPSLLFAGYGAPATPGILGLDADEGYYAQERKLAVFSGGFVAGPRDMFRPGIRGVLNSRDFDDPQASTGVAAISDFYDTTQLAGFGEGINTLELQLLARIDARTYHGLWRKGLWAEGFLGGAKAPTSYVHWGTEVSYDLPVWRDTRIFSFRTAVEGVAADVTEVPFSELPRLGGADRLRGYPEDAFRGTHAALLSVEYSYPIHKNVSGNLFADLGRVGTSVGDLASTDGWRLGGGGGVLIGSADDVTLRLSVAGGDRLQLFFGTDFAHAFDGRSEQL